jgi:hypothetical protein
MRMIVNLLYSSVAAQVTARLPSPCLQVCRLPWLKQSITEWLQQHGKQLPADASNCSLPDIEGARGNQLVQA